MGLERAPPKQDAESPPGAIQHVMVGKLTSEVKRPQRPSLGFSASGAKLTPLPPRHTMSQPAVFRMIGETISHYRINTYSRRCRSRGLRCSGKDSFGNSEQTGRIAEHCPEVRYPS